MKSWTVCLKDKIYFNVANKDVDDEKNMLKDGRKPAKNCNFCQFYLHKKIPEMHKIKINFPYPSPFLPCLHGPCSFLIISDILKL